MTSYSQKQKLTQRRKGHLGGCGPPFPKRRSQRGAPYRRLGFAVEVGEHDFVGEECGPFEGGGAVGIGSAQKLVLSIREFYEFSPSKLLDHLLATALRNQVF